jgi:L-ribulose-5-phosphate 3-epimerase UlaE
MKYKNKIGIMQGRLSPKTPGRLQTFPADEWRQEFFRARDIGYQCIEWLIDDYDLHLNPLFQPQDFLAIQKLISETGVTVESLCAHFFIDGSLSGRHGSKSADYAGSVLEKVVQVADDIGINNIIIPLMEGASLTTQGDYDGLKKTITTVNLKGCSLALELDLDAQNSIKLLEYMACDNVGLCYDIGNATALGYNASAELPSLLPFIYEIHIKDRIVGDGSHCLGGGATPVVDCLRVASEWGYSKPYILETPVEDDWKRCAEHNFAYIETAWSQHL